MEYVKIMVAVKWITLLVASSFIMHRLLDRVLPLWGRCPDRQEDDGKSVFEEALL
jgi:hypothetical protein